MRSFSVPRTALPSAAPFTMMRAEERSSGRQRHERKLRHDGVRRVLEPDIAQDADVLQPRLPVPAALMLRLAEPGPLVRSPISPPQLIFDGWSQYSNTPLSSATTSVFSPSRSFPVTSMRCGTSALAVLPASSPFR